MYNEILATNDVSISVCRTRVARSPWKIVFRQSSTSSVKGTHGGQGWLMWWNHPFYTGSRAICHHLKSSGNSRSSNSIKSVVRRVSRRTSINQTALDRRTQQELTKEFTTMITTLKIFTNITIT